MGELEDSIKRHPAGVLRKVAEQSPHDLGWALAKAAELATVAECERIIKLLGSFWCGEPACTKHPVRMDWVIAAIQGENK